MQSIQRLETLREEWDGLAAAFACPLLEHDWITSCAEAFHREDDLRVVTVRHHGELTAAAPLVRETTDGGNRLTLLGASQLYEPSGWIFSSAEAVAALAARAVAMGEPLVLSRVPEGSAIGRALGALPHTSALTFTRPAASALGVPTCGSWDAYYGGLSSQITRNLPRVRRKAEKAFGAVTFTQVAPALRDVDEFLETVVKIEGSGWKGRRGSALATRADLRSFFQRYCRRAAQRGALRVATLAFGSDVAAVELSVEAHGRVWQLKIGYREELGSYYPGLLLTEAAIHGAFERGLASYEFLGSAAEWEQRWAPEERRYQVMAVYPVSARNAVTLCRDAAAAVWRRAQAMGRAS